MDKGTPSLTEAHSTPSAADAIEHEIEDIRHNLDNLVSELDHRRHQLNPMVAARHHPVAFAVAGLVVVGAVAGVVALLRLRQRKVTSWSARGKRVGRAVTRLIRDPESTMPESPSVGKRVLAAGASAAAAVVARQLARRFWRPSS